MRSPLFERVNSGLDCLHFVVIGLAVQYTLECGDHLLHDVLFVGDTDTILIDCFANLWQPKISLQNLEHEARTADSVFEFGDQIAFASE